MLYIIRGLPGSGKSTLAKKLAVMHFEADMFFVGTDGVYRFDPSRLKDAHEWCFNKVKETIEDGYICAVSNTFSRVWEMQKYLDLPGPRTVITCEGSYGNIHGVSDEAIERMRARWEPYL